MKFTEEELQSALVLVEAYQGRIRQTAEQVFEVLSFWCGFTSCPARGYHDNPTPCTLATCSLDGMDKLREALDWKP